MSHPSNATLASLIEQHLKNGCKTNVAMAAQSGLFHQNIARYRHGTLPTKWLIPSLASALGIPVETLEKLVARERKSRVVADGRRVSCRDGSKRAGARVNRAGACVRGVSQ